MEGKDAGPVCSVQAFILHFKWSHVVWEQKTTIKEASERNLSAHYAFLMPVPLFPLLNAFHPRPSLPSWLRQRGVSIGYPLSPRLPGLLSHLHSGSCFCFPPSIHPSFVPFSLCLLHSIFYFFRPLSFFLSIVCVGHHAESRTAAGQRKADIQLCVRSLV